MEKLAPRFAETIPEEKYQTIVTDAYAQNTRNERDSILRPLEGKTIQITALNIDIVNSSLKVKALSSELAGEYYQKFIESTSDLIHDYGGHVLKNVGDSVIGFFPHVMHEPEQHNAVLCGLVMSDMVKIVLNPYYEKRNMPAMECRISADSGPVRVLSISSKDGYSVIDLFGSVMNSTTKILQYAKPRQMVIGDNLFWQLIQKDMFEFKLMKHWNMGKYSYPVYAVWRK
jgi:class 3 adenylate cyclase